MKDSVLMCTGTTEARLLDKQPNSAEVDSLLGQRDDGNVRVGQVLVLLKLR